MRSQRPRMRPTRQPLGGELGKKSAMVPGAMPRHESHLEMAERHVREGEERIARQRALVARLAQMAIRRTRQLGCKSFRPSSATTVVQLERLQISV